MSDHIVGVWLDSAGPNPGALFPDGTEPNPVFSVERGLLVWATHHDVLALREEADAARVKVQLPVLPHLQKTRLISAWEIYPGYFSAFLNASHYRAALLTGIKPSHLTANLTCYANLLRLLETQTAKYFKQTITLIKEHLKGHVFWDSSSGPVIIRNNGDHIMMW